MMKVQWLLFGLAACGAAPGEAPTYHGDIRAIVDDQCVSCHVAGGVGPFAMTFDEAEWADGPPAWASAAVAAVQEGRMPPWMPSDDCLPIEDARALTSEEKDLMGQWAEASFPVGEPADFVPPPARKTASDLGPPDLDVAPATAYTADPSRPDDYRCFVIDHDFPEDTWVRAFDVAPDRKELVHHVILYRVEPEDVATVEGWAAEEEAPGYTCFGSAGVDADTLAGWAPGQQPEVYPEGIARRIGKGSKLVMQVHYNTLNQPEGAALPADQSHTQLWLLPPGETPTRQLYSFPVLQTRMDIPPNDPHVVIKREMSLGNLPFEITVMGVFPHMHQLGKKIRLDRVEASGKTCLVRVPAWDFNWQQSYFFPEEEWVRIAPGDSFLLTCTYDNSAANQPVVNGVQQEPRSVGWGDSTLDEMCLVYAHVLVPPGLL